MAPTRRPRFGPYRGLVLAYGAPPPPMKRPRKDEVQTGGKIEVKTPEKVTKFLETEAQPQSEEKRRLRISSRIDENGEICVKIHLDGVLVSESKGHSGGTVTVETEV